MSLWARLFEHSNFGGRSTFALLNATSPPTTYLQISKGWLTSTNLHDKISSLQMGAGRDIAGGRVILFEHEQYRGRYAMFSTAGGSTRQIPSVAAQNFNDKTSSVLLVRTYTRELPPLALGRLGSPNLRTQIRSQITGIPRISPRGDPVITWDMWPGFSPSQKYVYVRIPVRVDVPNWFDYDAEIRLWIYLYVSATGKVRGYVAWYGAWVEGGILTGKILDQVMEALPGRIGSINQMISNALTMLEDFTFVGLYYLPGTAQGTGHVDDDVSIVLVKQW